MNLTKGTWLSGTKYGIENLAVNDQKTVPYPLSRIRSAITMYVKRNRLDWKFRTAMERDGVGTRIIRIK